MAEDWTKVERPETWEEWQRRKEIENFEYRVKRYREAMQNVLAGELGINMILYESRYLMRHSYMDEVMKKRGMV